MPWGEIVETHAIGRGVTHETNHRYTSRAGAFSASIIILKFLSKRIVKRTPLLRFYDKAHKPNLSQLTLKIAEVKNGNVR